MKTVTTGLGMKLEVTPLVSAAEELLQLWQDEKDIKEKIEKQKTEVIRLMKEKKQYSIRIGAQRLDYCLIEENETVKIKKA